MPEQKIQLPNDIVGLIADPWAWLSYVYIALIVVLITALLIVLWWFFMKRGKKKQLSPFEFYYQKLIQFPIKSNPSDDFIKESFFVLNQLLRSFLEIRFGFRATDMTYRELEKSILKHPVASNHVHQYDWTTFLQFSDAVKFAGVKTNKKALEDSIVKVKKWALELKPEETKGASK